MSVGPVSIKISSSTEYVQNRSEDKKMIHEIIVSGALLLLVGMVSFMLFKNSNDEVNETITRDMFPVTLRFKSDEINEINQTQKETALSRVKELLTRQPITLENRLKAAKLLTQIADKKDLVLSNLIDSLNREYRLSLRELFENVKRGNLNKASKHAKFVRVCLGKRNEILDVWLKIIEGSGGK